jgi:hypothetical protein
MKLIAVLLAAGALTGAGSKVTFIEHGVFTHPGDKGTWTMTGAIADRGSYVRVCVDCSSGAGNRVDLRATYKGKRGTFVLLFRVRPAKTSWSMLSGTRLYAGLHGNGTCVTKIIVNEVSLRSTCVGTIAR